MKPALLLLCLGLCVLGASAHPWGWRQRSRGWGGWGWSWWHRIRSVLRANRNFHDLKCLVTDSNGEEVTEFPWYAPLNECEEGFTCSVGPLTINKWREQFNVTFCNTVDDDGNLLVVSNFIHTPTSQTEPQNFPGCI